MGCGLSQKDQSNPIRLNTVSGKLRVTITSATLYHEASHFKMDPYIMLKLSNQEKRTITAVKGDKEPLFNETFDFYINSCYKVHGRNLELTIMDQKKIKPDAEVGFGIVDLDPIINFKKPKEELRCFINYKRENAGIVNLVAEFIEEPSRTLSFRFDTALIRRRTSKLTNMHCWIQVTIGQEILSTCKCKDTKEAPPVWFNQILTFNVTQSITHCKIEVFDDEAIVGSLEMLVHPLLQATEELHFNKEFEFDVDINAGTIKFDTLSGVNPQFSSVQPSVLRYSKIQKYEEKENRQPVEYTTSEKKKGIQVQSMGLQESNQVIKVEP